MALPPAAFGGDGRPPMQPPFHEPKHQGPDPRMIREMAERRLREHPKLRKSWERMNADQRKKLVERVCGELGKRKQEMDRDVMKFKDSPRKLAQKKEEFRQKVQKRIDERRKDVRPRRDREKPDRRGRE